MAVNRLDRLGRLSGMWLDMATRSQNQGMLGHPRAIRMILLHGESCNFTTLPNMADGEVYAFRSYHGRPVTQNRGDLLLSLVANKFIWAGATYCIRWKTSGRRNHCLDGLA